MMKHFMIQGCCVITLILTAIICDGNHISLSGHGNKVFQEYADIFIPIHKHRTLRSLSDENLNATKDEPEPTLERELVKNSPQNSSTSKDEPIITNKDDTASSTNSTIEKREDIIGKSIGFTDGPNIDTHRTGLLFGYFPVVGQLPYPFRAYRPPPIIPPPHPPIHFKPSFGPPHKPEYGPRPKPEYGPPPKPEYGPPPKPEYGPPPKPDYGPPKPPPLPPFPPGGPHFPHADHDDDYVSQKPYHPDNPHHGSHSSEYGEDEGFHVEEFQVDFSPPDFFENSGFPHPPEENHFQHSGIPPYEEEHYNPIHPYEGGGGGHYPPPLRPLLGGNEDVEDNHNIFEPIIYHGPPKTPIHFSVPPKPHPPSPPKLTFPLDVNVLVKNNIYRDDIPVKEVHNDRDKIHDDLEHGGIKGLDPQVLEFIEVHTKPYLDSQNEFDAR